MLRLKGVLVCIGVAVVLLAGAGGVVADAPHTHPDDVDDESDLDAVGQWLGDRMGEIHADCSEGVGVGSFDACDALDDEHEEFLDQYVTVEDETETDRASDRFETTRADHIEYIELLEEFYATLDAYEAARQEGDDERAAELAAELRQLETRITDLGVQLQVNFEELDALTTIDLDPASENTNQTTTEASVLYSAVESETFTETTLTADANATASFAEAATITGELRDENGTAIENGRIIIDDGDQVLEARTDSEGAFAVEFRPAPVSTVGETEIDVRYEPVGEEPYQRANDTVAIDIEATTSTVEVEPLSPAAFQEPVSVSGVVQADGVAIGDVPVRVQLADGNSTTIQTDTDGRFETAIPLPMTIPTGTATVEVAIGDSEFALEPSTASTTLEVIETPTTLSVGAATDNETATIFGQVQTTDGVAVPTRPIEIEVAGERYTTETDEAGEFEIEIAAAETDRDAVVTYDDPETNLEASNETVVVAEAEVIEQTPTETAYGFLSTNPLLAGLLVLVGVANVLVWSAIAVLLWRRRRAPSTPESVDSPDDAAKAESIASEADSRIDADAMFPDPSETELSPDLTVQRAYATVRSVFGDDADTDTRTHWEFYREVASDADPDTQNALRTVTEAFEAATFSPVSVDETRATDAVEAAKRCVAVSDGGVVDDD